MQFQFLAACSGISPSTPATGTSPATFTPEMVVASKPFNTTNTPFKSWTPSLQTTVSLDLRLSPDRWQEWPVIPETVSQCTREIYQNGLELGNNPHAFSKIGDGGAATVWFLIDFDPGGEYLNLGVFSHLQGVIDNSSGSFGRTSIAAGQRSVTE